MNSKISPYLRIQFIYIHLFQLPVLGSTLSCAHILNSNTISTQHPIKALDTSHRSDLVIKSSQGNTTYTTNRPLGFIVPSLSHLFFYKNSVSSGFKKYSYLESLNRLESQDVVMNLGAGQFLESLVFASKTPWGVLNSQNGDFALKNHNHINNDILKITKTLHELELSNKLQFLNSEQILSELLTKHPEFTVFDPNSKQQLLQPHLAISPLSTRD